MLDMISGPTWGILTIASIGGLITIGCFTAMFWFMFHPGEKDPGHKKNDILRRDR